MSLGSLLNPLHAPDPFHITGGSSGSGGVIGQAINAAQGASDQQNSAPITQAMASDPSYGSFAQPFDIQNFYQNIDPSYFLRMQQGQQGLMNSAAAGNGALSGSALKDLMDYNQNAASQEYGNAYNRYQTTQGNIFNRLMSIAGLGQAGASGTASNNTSLAGTTGQALQNAGTAAGSGLAGFGGAIGNAGMTYGGMQYLKQNPGVV